MRNDNPEKNNDHLCSTPDCFCIGALIAFFALKLFIHLMSDFLSKETNQPFPLYRQRAPYAVHTRVYRCPSPPPLFFLLASQDIP